MQKRQQLRVMLRIAGETKIDNIVLKMFFTSSPHPFVARGRDGYNDSISSIKYPAQLLFTVRVGKCQNSSNYI